MTDEQIIGRVRGGETRLFEELVRRYQDQVYAMAARLVGVSGDAEDVAQEAFLKAFRGLDGFKGDAKFSTWLYRITWNLCTDWLRRNRKPGRQHSSIDEAPEVADSRVDVAGSLVESERREEIRRALEELPEKYRSVVTLMYFQKMPYDQISSVLGLPLKTIETRLYRARRMLRERLAAMDERSRE
jgi:RNA polymerase sigma-70 factor (ECF subfamily)